MNNLLRSSSLMGVVHPHGNVTLLIDDDGDVDQIADHLFVVNHL